jgi:hypothetical protein
VIPRRYKIAGSIAALVVAIPVFLIAVDVGSVLFDEHRVRSMCAKLAAGTSVANAKNIVVAAGFGRFISGGKQSDQAGSYDKVERNWFFAVPVAAAMGDDRCAVYHDGHTIIKAEMESH